ncbi:MAG: hypothetical protein U9R42_01065, partial [Bacteroidota bacterium]|nr:hypothetical protein [Bacteroidota bacterium]
PINGTTYYGIRWTGTTNAIWETASNWYNSVIPDALQTCQIIGSLTNYPQINSNVEITKLVVESGASITINPTYSLTVTGTLTNNAGNSGVVVASTSSGTGNLIHSTQNVAGTVKRYIAGSTSNPYHFISSPIDGAAFSSIWSTGDYNVYWYDETDNDVDMDVGWTRISSGTLTNGRGYAIVGDANKTLSITGDLTVPDDISTISVSYTATTGTYPNGDPRGWNLIGNPFPTALTASTFITDNTSSLGSSWQALYYFDDANGDRTRTADYSTRTTTIGAAGSGAASGAPTDKIPVGQGFFVNVNSGVSTLSVTAAQRTTNAGSQFFIPAIDYINNIWVYVEGPSNNYNEIAFSFLAKATKNHDPIFDAAKLRGNPDIALYSFVKDSDVEYVIQGRPLFKNEDIVNIGIHAGVEGEYTFKMKKSTNSSNTENVYLIDLYKNKTTQITNTSGYTIYLSPNEYKDRFLLKFENKANSNDEKLTESSEIEVFIYNNKIHFINTDFEGEVIVSDILGKTLLNFNLCKTENRNVYLPEYRGVVIVKLVDKKGITTKKLYSR